MRAVAKNSRIDYVFANSTAISLVERVGLRWDLGFATHAALQVFRTAAPEQALIRQPVPALSGAAAEGWSPEIAMATASAVLEAHGEAFQRALGRHDVEAAWQALNSAMCKWLATRLGSPTVPGRTRRLPGKSNARPRLAAAGKPQTGRLMRRCCGCTGSGGCCTLNAGRAATQPGQWMAALRTADVAHAEWAAELAALRANE